MRGLGNIRLATLNIRSGREGCLEAALRVLIQGNVDVGVLQETKVTDGIQRGRERGTTYGRQRKREGTGV